MEEGEKFQDILKRKMDDYVQLVYFVTKNFPRDELYGVTSQLRRAALSEILNYIEGYARIKSGVHLNFFETSYGSLKESKYLPYFSKKQNYIRNEKDYQKALQLSEEIGKMLWCIIDSKKNK